MIGDLNNFQLERNTDRERDLAGPTLTGGSGFLVEDSPGPNRTENLRITKQPEPVEDSLGPRVDRNRQPVNELFVDDNGNLNTAGLDDKEKEILTEDLQAQKAGFPVPGVKMFIVLILIGLVAYLINEDLI